MRWSRVTGGTALVAVLAVGVLITSCAGWGSQEHDMTGTTESEALKMPMEQQYERAGERYTELHERLAALQGGIFADEWNDGATHSEVIPFGGYSTGNGLRHDNRDNSYLFTATRWYSTDADLTSKLRDAARTWEARGWEVTEETFSDGSIRISTRTEDGFWFAASDDIGRVKLTGHTPVYWGDLDGLIHAIAERRNAEDDAGATWDTTDRDENGHAFRLPGVFRPFPAWDAVPE